MALNYKSSLVRYRRYLMAVEKNSTYKASMFVVLSLLLILGMVLFALRPTLLTIADLVNQIEQQKKLSMRLQDKIEVIREAADQLALVREKMPILDQALPKNPEWLSWVNSVETISLNSRVEVQNISAGPVVTTGKDVAATASARTSSRNATTLPKGVNKIDFTIIVSGQYDQVKKFVEDLENLRRVTKISDLQFSKQDDGGIIITTIRGAIGYMNQLPKP